MTQKSDGRIVPDGRRNPIRTGGAERGGAEKAATVKQAGAATSTVSWDGRKDPGEGRRS
ncbi:hypothetical protein ACFL5O_06815 [Myxococcota bacterium]